VRKKNETVFEVKLKHWGWLLINLSVLLCAAK